MARAFFLLLAVGLLPACGSSGGSDAPPPPPPPPPPFVVVSTVPAAGAVGVAVASTISATFSADANGATITTSTFTMTACGGGVTGTVVYDNPSRTATFTPAVSMTAATFYTVTLTGGIQNASGAALTPATFSFTTGGGADTTPPLFAGAASAAAENALRILVSWSAACDNGEPPASIRYRVYRALLSGTQNFASPLATTAPGATSYADGGLTASTAYFYVVRAMDSSNNEETNTVERTATTPAIRSWSSDVFPLLSICATCHGANGGLTLTPIATAYGELVNVVSNLDGGCSTLRRVDPFDSALSHFFKKLEGTQDCGSRMPQGGPFFSAPQLDTVRDWIDEGAPNN